MAVTQTAVSYYGLNYVEHAEKDFQEMLDHGCTTVILAVTEFDFDFWRPNIPKIVAKAHEMGLRVLIDPWGNGKYFGGEQVSKFLQDNVENRQVSALTGEKLPYACFNTNSYRDYFRNFCVTLARETSPDGFFWDEPHYAFPKGIASITGGVADDWTCFCPVCRKRFSKNFNSMPITLKFKLLKQIFSNIPFTCHCYFPRMVLKNSRSSQPCPAHFGDRPAKITKDRRFFRRAEDRSFPPRGARPGRASA